MVCFDIARIIAHGALILLALIVFAIGVFAVGRYGVGKASDSGWGRGFALVS